MDPDRLAVGGAVAGHVKLGHAVIDHDVREVGAIPILIINIVAIVTRSVQPRKLDHVLAESGTFPVMVELRG